MRLKKHTTHNSNIQTVCSLKKRSKVKIETGIIFPLQYLKSVTEDHLSLLSVQSQHDIFLIPLKSPASCVVYSNCWLSWHSSCSCNHAGESLPLTGSSFHLFGIEAPVSPVTISSRWTEESHVHVSTWDLCWCYCRKSMSCCPAVLSHACPDFLFALSRDTAQVSDSQILRANPFHHYLLKVCKLECNFSAAW